MIIPDQHRRSFFDWIAHHDFGTGCTDNHNNTRKGKITIAYRGAVFFQDLPWLPHWMDMRSMALKSKGRVLLPMHRTVRNRSALYDHHDRRCNQLA